MRSPQAQPAATGKRACQYQDLRFPKYCYSHRCTSAAVADAAVVAAVPTMIVTTEWVTPLWHPHRDWELIDRRLLRRKGWDSGFAASAAAAAAAEAEADLGHHTEKMPSHSGTPGPDSWVAFFFGFEPAEATAPRELELELDSRSLLQPPVLAPADQCCH